MSNTVKCRCNRDHTGFLALGEMLERFGVEESNWRDGGKKDKNFLKSKSPLFVRSAVAALATDAGIMERTGELLSSWEVAREYGMTDVDGRRPDWGAHDIDFSRHPPALLELIQNGATIQLKWARTLAKRTERFVGQLPADRSRAMHRPVKRKQRA